MTIQVVEPDLNTTGFSGFASKGSDVDGAIAPQDALDSLIH
jgi:hypothetical protein